MVVIEMRLVLLCRKNKSGLLELFGFALFEVGKNCIGWLTFLSMLAKPNPPKWVMN